MTLEHELSRGADVGVDPFFTARVLSSLPARPFGASLSPWRRFAVLVGAYCCAGAIGYLALGDEQSEAMSGASTALHGLMEQGDGDPLAWGAAVILPLTLLAVAFVTTKTHNEFA